MKKKKSGKYSDRSRENKRRRKREVISYEDMPLEEYEDDRTEISKPAVKRILIIAGIILVLGLITFAVANRDSLTPERIGNWFKYDVLGSKDTGFPVDIQGSGITQGNFLYNGNITYVSDTAFVTLSNDGNEMAYNQITFAEPEIVADGDKVIVYNLGGIGYAVGTQTELSNTKDTKEDIFTADINSKGYYCVVTKADGYLSKLHVYNNHNEKLYSYSFSDYYVTSVALNNDGTGCVACGLAGKDGSISSVAYVLDFAKEEPKATFSLDDNTIYDVEYLDGGNVCMIGSQASFTLDIGGANLNQIDYNQMQLTSYDINTDTASFVLSLSRSGDGRKCSLEYINKAGEIVSVNDTELACESISLYKNRLAVLQNNTCYLFDTEGTKIGKAKTGNGSLAVKLESPSTAYILGINEIRKIIKFE